VDYNQFYGERFKQFGGLKYIDNNFFVSSQYSYVYANVPKVACSTIKKVLVTLVEQTNVDFNVNKRESNPLKRPSEIFDDVSGMMSFYVFSFVRNPYDRALSAYLDKIVGNKPEKKIITNILDCKEDEKLSFDDFLFALTKVPCHRLETHFRPQSLLLCLSEVEYNYIGRFEALAEGLDIILKKIAPHSKKSIKSSLKVLSVRHHKTNATAKRSMYMSQKAIRLVNDIYASDFINFDYKTL
jgi:hypothetical protein